MSIQGLNQRGTQTPLVATRINVSTAVQMGTAREKDGNCAGKLCVGHGWRSVVPNVMAESAAISRLSRGPS